MLTHNNPDIEDYSKYITVGEWVRFAVWQVERVNTNHIQGYVELNKAAELSRMRLVFPGCHLVNAAGSHAQCVAYCTKAESRVDGPWECGDRARPGTRTDINTIRDKVIAGVSNKEIILDDHLHPTYARLYRYVAHLRLELATPRDFLTKVIVLWGSTGIGKSRLAAELCPSAFYYSNTKGSWFDGYDGTSDVIFDDFYGNLPRHLWLQLCDRYPCRVESKGGMINFAPKTIIFTSNKPPWEWYHDKEGTLMPWAELERRISETYTFPLPTNLIN